MSVWKLYVFGWEILRVEQSADADKSLAEALRELADESDFTSDGQDFVSDGREAGDDEHLIFLGLDDLHDHVGEEDVE